LTELRGKTTQLAMIGVRLTTLSALILIGFSVIDVFGHGGSANPYVGIIGDLCLAALFVLGLILIPIGILLRRRKLKAAGQLPTEYPKVDLSNPAFREALVSWLVPHFYGQACHVMAPEFAAYQVYPHSDVACTECHIAAVIPGFIHAKLNGTKQMIQVVFGTYPRPIMPEGKIPAASTTSIAIIWENSSATSWC
jgi:hypothetical protein